MANNGNHLDADPPGDNPQQDAPPPVKFHHFTICMVPPQVNKRAWQELTRARTDLRDPGLFRWPPHANLLYPFVDPKRKINKGAAGNDSSDDPPAVETEILERLQMACQQVEPFSVRLDRLGTFGGAKRGVLWMYPSSCREEMPQDHNQQEPLIELQACLQDAFPYCKEQQKVSGAFNPHMTLSHYVTLDEAQQAQEQVEAWWDTSIEFVVDEIYLLSRKGDAGQFQRLATLGLGARGEAKVHDPTLPFESMPREEADWVRQERMKMKQRRNRKGGGRGGRRRRTRSRPPPDTPEVIAQKRAERKANREALDRQAAAEGES